MKKIIVGVFAHPDDEAFGPSGTLFKLRSEGYDIHLILLTDGEAGTNPDAVPDLGVVRLHEWQASADILGAQSTHALHYPDGGLENISLSELENRVERCIKDSIKSYEEPIELSLMSFEPHGLTGHRDHIVASELTRRMITLCNAKAVWYFCLDSSQAPLDGTAYYQPRARENSYITDRIDVSVWLEDKYRMMDAHASQRADAETMKKLNQRVENFHIETY